MTMYIQKKNKLYVSFDDLIKQYLYSQSSVDIIIPKSTIRLVKKLSKNYDIIIVTKLNILIIEKTLRINKLIKLNKDVIDNKNDIAPQLFFLLKLNLFQSR